MRFIFGKQDSPTLERAQERCWLLANGLGGYMSASAAFSVTRRDQSILMAAVTPPAKRVNLVHRLSETLAVGERWEFLSTQVFADGREPEKGYRHLSAFVWDGAPSWLYHVEGVQVRRQCAVEYGANTAAVAYTIENRSPLPCTLRVRPFTPDAARTVREQLEPVEAMLREGCVGQIPEIYDGGTPGPSKGCFAQAWSVGELLRVYEQLENIEKEADSHAG